MNKMSIYNRLPVWGQNLACYYEGSRIKRTRYGKTFWRFLAEYESHNDWSYEQLCDYRDMRLRKMIHHCYDTVPYYNKLFNEGGINPDRIKTIDDLKVLPILTKDIVNANPESFISTAIPRNKMITAHTSGTTGSGFVFQTTQNALCDQWAVWWRYRRKLGIKFGTLCANFGTRLIVPFDQSRPPYWRYNKPCYQMYFSAFHESPDNLIYYIDEIKRQRITWLHGYPSLLAVLAAYVINQKISCGEQIKHISIGAENLLENQRELITRAFGVKPVQHYGMSEGVANFSEQPDGSIIVDEDYGAVEFVPLSNGISAIIASGLTNYAMPLLRWDTKDTASATETPKGRRVISIDGRIEDYILLPNGRKIGKLDSVFKDTVNLREVQIRQNADYSIVVYAVKNCPNVENDISIAMDMFRSSLGDDIDISFKFVEAIPRTASGKLRFVVSELDNRW